MKTLRFNAVQASQAPDNCILSFAATPDEILSFAHIERIGRQEDGKLRGFQRHQIASHIKEIRDYLTRDDALLPNAVIVAFIKGEGVRVIEGARPQLEVTFGVDKPGFVVDGQQRLSALSGITKPGFQVFVSALICKDYNQLRQQFVLINNTRPLPKALIYELLPNVVGLPERFTSRTLAARLVDRLNFRSDSSLHGEIRQHTNPLGVISDIAMQKLLMNSTSDGAIRGFIKSEDLDEKAFHLVSEFFSAVKEVYGPEWVGMSPRTSRLRHGAGIVSMGFVMEYLHSELGANTNRQFVPGLELLKRYTAWTSGQWHLSENDIRPWNGIQNTSTDIDLLSNHLIRSLKKALKRASR